MVAMVRLMPNHDPDWRLKVELAVGRRQELMGRKGMLTDRERDELAGLGSVIDEALNARFRTTAEYRDFYFDRARKMLEAEGIDMPIPHVADDATVEEIDRALATVWAAVEVTNSETF